MSESRTKNSFKNIIGNNIFQLLNIILSFITRTIFIKTLGENFLGINGLFTNILSILSLAELGIGTAMLYNMYKPVANDDKEKIKALISYYKVLYRRIAIIIFVIGVSIIPLLKYIVNIKADIGPIQFYYFLYLSNSACSYLLLYKTSIIVASQKEYLIKKYDVTFLIIRTVLQSIVLVVFKSYILYLIIQIISTLTSNLLKSKRAEKDYSYIKEKRELPQEDKKEIWKNIKSLLFYQIGNTILNHTDNILISIIVGTLFVGYYSNYSMVISAVASFSALIFTSLQASIGNFNIKSSKKNKLKLYKTLNFLAFSIYGFFAIGFLTLFQDFITFWIGEQYLLTKEVLLIVILNFYISGILYPNWCFRYTTDLFDKAKFAIVACALLNIVLSIILGLKWGMFGIFIATGISRLCTTFWYEPYILYKTIFKTKIKEYFINQIYNLIILVLMLGIIIYICSFITLENLIIRMVIKAIIFAIIYLSMYLLLFRKKEEFIFLKEKIISLVKK